jgi:hypothetical protein
MNTLLLFAGATAALALAAAPALAADPREEARVRQTVLAIPTNIDIHRFDAVEPLFAERVVIDYTSLWGGEPQTMTPAELVTAWRGIVPGFDATWHEIDPVAVTVDGAEARATTSVDGRHWIGERVWRPIGRYDFRLAKIDGAWRVTSMALTVTEEQGERALVDLARDRAAAR